MYALNSWKALFYQLKMCFSLVVIIHMIKFDLSDIWHNIFVHVCHHPLYRSIRISFQMIFDDVHTVHSCVKRWNMKKKKTNNVKIKYHRCANEMAPNFGDAFIRVSLSWKRNVGQNSNVNFIYVAENAIKRFNSKSQDRLVHAFGIDRKQECVGFILIWRNWHTMKCAIVIWHSAMQCNIRWKFNESLEQSPILSKFSVIFTTNFPKTCRLVVFGWQNEWRKFEAILLLLMFYCISSHSLEIRGRNQNKYL